MEISDEFVFSVCLYKMRIIAYFYRFDDAKLFAKRFAAKKLKGDECYVLEIRKNNTVVFQWPVT